MDPNLAVSGQNALKAIGVKVTELRRQVERNFIESVTEPLSPEKSQEQWGLVLQLICRIEGSISEEHHHLEEEGMQAAL